MKKNIGKDTILLKRSATPPRKEKYIPESAFISPVTGLAQKKRGDKERLIPAPAIFPRESVLWLLILGAHMGRFPVKSANFPPSPLMEGHLSGKRGAFSLVNQQNISVQLIRAFYIIAVLLKKGARILLINDGDDRNLPKQIFPSYRRRLGHYEQNQQKQVVSGERLIISQGAWKAGTCSNWLEICKKVWNWSHCKQFLAHSPRGKDRGIILGREKQFFQQSISPDPQGKRRGTKERRTAKYPQVGKPFVKGNRETFAEQWKKNLDVPLLYYTKKPDLILLLTGKKNSSLIVEAQALKVPLLYMADTDFSEIQHTFASSSDTPLSSIGCKIKTRLGQRSLFANASYACVGNSDSFPLSFLLSSLLSQIVSSGNKK